LETAADGAAVVGADGLSEGLLEPCEGPADGLKVVGLRDGAVEVRVVGAVVVGASDVGLRDGAFEAEVVGEAVVVSVGATVGTLDGFAVINDDDGSIVLRVVSELLTRIVGTTLGDAEVLLCFTDGLTDGTIVGDLLDFKVGATEGTKLVGLPTVGKNVGALVGPTVGAAVGEKVGGSAGGEVGTAFGNTVGICVDKLGIAVGLKVGLRVGNRVTPTHCPNVRL
jgi:hypothetical protein